MVKDKVILERRFVPKGTVIIKEGDEGYSAYLIQSGKVEVCVKKDDEHEVVLSTLGAGEIFGEMSLISDHVRTASVRAVKNCNLVIITRAVFEEKLKKSDATIQAVVHMLIRRIILMNKGRLEREKGSEDKGEKGEEDKGSTKGETSDIFWDF
ncbi:MAG: cyclic nucleotide-binding domain-containing protein [Alphaproteobacteria bacterium]|nr:cyclic nucleotide-binding domain-containing protein [Alphaproteobacteria bacterium]